MLFYIEVSSVEVFSVEVSSIDMSSIEMCSIEVFSVEVVFYCWSPCPLVTCYNVTVSVTSILDKYIIIIQ